jgi:hypothetical protein
LTRSARSTTARESALISGEFQPVHLEFNTDMPNRNKTSYEFSLTPVHKNSAFCHLIKRYFLIHSNLSDIPPLSVLLPAANTLLASTVRWPPGKTYYDGMVQTFIQKSSSGPSWHGRLRCGLFIKRLRTGVNELSVYTLFALPSHHPIEQGTFHDFWEVIGTSNRPRATSKG